MTREYGIAQKYIPDAEFVMLSGRGRIIHYNSTLQFCGPDEKEATLKRFHILTRSTSHISADEAGRWTSACKPHREGYSVEPSMGLRQRRRQEVLDGFRKAYSAL